MDICTILQKTFTLFLLEGENSPLVGEKRGESGDIKGEDTGGSITVRKKLIIHRSQIVMRLCADASRSMGNLWAKWMKKM